MTVLKAIDVAAHAVRDSARDDLVVVTVPGLDGHWCVHTRRAPGGWEAKWGHMATGWRIAGTRTHAVARMLVDAQARGAL